MISSIYVLICVDEKSAALGRARAAGLLKAGVLLHLATWQRGCLCLTSVCGSFRQTHCAACKLQYCYTIG